MQVFEDWMSQFPCEGSQMTSPYALLIKKVIVIIRKWDELIFDYLNLN